MDEHWSSEELDEDFVPDGHIMWGGDPADTQGGLDETLRNGTIKERITYWAGRANMCRHEQAFHARHPRQWAEITRNLAAQQREMDAERASALQPGGRDIPAADREAEWLNARGRADRKEADLEAG